MPQAKPGINWPAIRVAYEAGAGQRELARQHGVSHQAIQQRIAREGWLAPSEASLPAAPADLRRAIAKEKTTPAGLPELPQDCLGQRSVATALWIVDAVGRHHVSPKVAAKAAGLSKKAFAAWLEADPFLAAHVEAAEARSAAAMQAVIGKAAERGDYRAAQVLLGHNEATKQEWNEKKESGGGGIIVQFNWDRDPPSNTEPKVVDVTPDC